MKNLSLKKQGALIFMSVVLAAASCPEIAHAAGTAVPKADIFNVDFSEGYKDQSTMKNPLKETVGSPEIAPDEELNRSTANFNGASAYQYYFGKENYDRMKEKLAMECMVKFNDIPSGEHDFFSNQESGGIGLGLNGGRLTFFAHVGGSYRQPSAEITANQWYHVVGVVDGKAVKLYVDGELVDRNDTAENSGLQGPWAQRARSMVLGGDVDSNGDVQFLSDTEIAFARIYSDSLTDDQIKAMSKEAFEKTDAKKRGEVKLDLAGSSTAAANSVWNLNLHASRNKSGSVDKIEYDIVYDDSVLEYKAGQLVADGVQITEGEGRLHITSTRELLADNIRNYSTTRLGKLDFQVKNVEKSCEAVVRVENFRAYASGNDITDEIGNLPEAEKVLNVYSKNALDLNGDGVIGAGDVALAEGEMQSEVAAEASIYPYKHAVILTMDGSGTVWDPESIYYTWDNNTLPTKHDEEWAMSKRKNTYAMELLNKEFATSYTAQAVVPSISAQNYFSILHGLKWGEAPIDYQLDNDIAKSRYFADFGRKEALYPSVFKVMEKAFPERPNAAFAEWGAIVNGIVESDAQVKTQNSESKKSFYDVADYILSDAYKNTGVVYMQNDWMDHVGHSIGYYSDGYWDELLQYDEQYKAVIDALKESGEYDETLIVTNADHGGSGYGHGSMDPSNMDIFIGVGGETVNSGKRLYGGTNADIAPIVLSALRTEIPESMTGGVFDERMFLTQEELKTKNRDVEKVVLNSTEKNAEILLTEQKQEIRAIDAVIELNGAEVSSVKAENGKVVRKVLKNGKLYVTVAYERQPEKLLDIFLKNEAENGIAIEEIMLGTQSGEEVYPDLENNFEKGEDASADITSLNAAVTMAERLEEEQERSAVYTEESWAGVQTALDQARILLSNPKATQKEVDNAFLELMTAVNLLESNVQKVGLGTAIEGAKAILADEETLAGYTPESVEALRSALAEAEAVYEDKEADQTAVNQAATNLMTAVNNLLVTETDSRLDILIQTAEELLLREDQYTGDSIQALRDALEAAKTIAENKNASEQEINDAYNALAEAMVSLVRVANKAELKNALDKAGEILDNAGKYIDSSLEGLQEAKDAAQGVYDNDNAVRKEIEEVLKVLINEILEVRLLGDVNLDGAVDSADARVLLRYQAELDEFSEEQLDAADVNRDDVADSSDAVLILQYAAEMIEEF